MAEWINENMYVRKNLRRLFQRKAMVTSKVVKSKKEEEGADGKAKDDSTSIHAGRLALTGAWRSEEFSSNAG